jgi:hypothetical protein
LLPVTVMENIPPGHAESQFFVMNKVPATGVPIGVGVVVGATVGVGVMNTLA